MESEHERYLAEKFYGGPIIVTNYPKDIKAFYMKLDGDGKTVQAMDILVPRIGEIIGGSVREDRYEVLLERAAEMGVDIAHLGWYLDLRKVGQYASTTLKKMPSICLKSGLLPCNRSFIYS